MHIYIYMFSESRPIWEQLSNSRNKSHALVLGCLTGEGLYIITNLHLSVFKVNPGNDFPKSQSNFITSIFFPLFFWSHLQLNYPIQKAPVPTTQTQLKQLLVINGSHIIASYQIFPAMATHCASLLEFSFFFVKQHRFVTWLLSCDSHVITTIVLIVSQSMDTWHVWVWHQNQNQNILRWHINRHSFTRANDCETSL